MPSNSDRKMTARERRAVWSLSGVYIVRMLGLFMVLPVLALYTSEMHGVTPLLIGLAIGIYGLAQAVLQIPLGLLSDRIGRKPVILGGLLVLIAGSVIAAWSESIQGIILGRALQGAGAIASATLALAADLTREEQRTKAMAAIGISIGAAFFLAVIIGPLVGRGFGLAGIFWLTALLGIGALLIVLLLIPDPEPLDVSARGGGRSFTGVLRNAQLLRLDLGVFVLHLVLASNFVAVPLLLRDGAGLEAADHGLFYLPVLLLSLALALPAILAVDRHLRTKTVLLTGVALLAGSELAFLFIPYTLLAMALLLAVFFAAFNLLESILPSLTSRLAPVHSRGAAMGVYSSSQFLGIFTGGVLGGLAYGHSGAAGVFLLGSAALLLWLVTAAGMRNPGDLSHYVLRVGPVDDRQAEATAARLARVPGVAEVRVIAAEGAAYLKVDRAILDERSLREVSVASA